jgi:hypothetical protein
MMNTPSMYSVDQLLKARQNGVPDYVVVPMLQKAMAQKQAMAQQQALQQGAPKPPVAQQILDAAHNDVMQDHMARQVEEQPEARGIDSLPSGIDESDYAHGGIIAFNGEEQSDVPSEFYEEEEGLRLPAAKGNNYFNSRSLDGGEGWAEFEHPEDSFRQFAHQLSLYKKRGVNTPDKFINTYSPKNENDTKRLMGNINKWTGLEPDQEVDLEDPEVVSKLAHATLRNERSLNLPPSEINKLISKGYSKRGEEMPTSKGIASLPEAKGSMVFPAAPEDMPMPHSKEEESAAYKAKELQDLLGEDPNAARREARLSKREADLAEEKDRSPWMALMQAGLSTMAGTSPNALSNIGAGATEGLKSYGEARKDISKSSDKLMDLRDEVETAQRAEKKAIKLKGFESAEAAKAANVKADAENKLRKYEHGVKGAEYGQKERELADKGALYKAEADYYKSQSTYKPEAAESKQGLEERKLEQSTVDSVSKLLEQNDKDNKYFPDRLLEGQQRILGAVPEPLRLKYFGHLIKPISQGAPVIKPMPQVLSKPTVKGADFDYQWTPKG